MELQLYRQIKIKGDLAKQIFILKLQRDLLNLWHLEVISVTKYIQGNKKNTFRKKEFSSGNELEIKLLAFDFESKKRVMGYDYISDEGQI